MVAAAVPLMLAMVMEMGARAAAMEAFSEKDLDNYYKRMYDFGLGKRAYVYSANKRPMYDFGIGKRDNNRQRMYAFGLGKRPDGSALSALDQDSALDDQESIGGAPWKRALKQYEFGLGKRAQGKMQYSFGLGKRAREEEEDTDEDGDVEKRSRYQFGLGKRSSAFNNDRYYDGSSERSLRSQRYNFGLGKRDLGPDWQDLLLGEDAGHEVAARSMKYGFGLGKREISNEALDDVESVLANSEKIPASMLTGGHKSNTRKRDTASASQLANDKQPEHQRR